MLKVRTTVTDTLVLNLDPSPDESQSYCPFWSTLPHFRFDPPGSGAMSSPPNNRRPPGRHLSDSRSITQSIYGPTASSRPFLNMLNPLGRAYQGYTAANQSVLEEDEEDNDGATPSRNDDIDLEAQAHLTPTGKTPQRISRGGTEASILRPNVREDDRVQEESDSDGEVPQSFLIESPAVRRAPLSRKGRPREAHFTSQTTAPADPPRISVPPRPSEIGAEHPPSPSPSPRVSPASIPPNPKRGLDAYERALWNWIPASTLTTSHDCPILSSSAVSLGTFFPAVSIIRLFDCSSF